MKSNITNKSKKRIKKLINKNKELLLGLIVGLILSGATVYAATIYYASDEVSYDDTKVTGTLGATDVQGALTKLNEKIEENCMKKTVTVQATNGTVTAPSTKEVANGATATFTVSPNSGYGNGTVSCTNSQTATLSGTTLTTGAITNDTTCTVTFTATASWHYSNDYNRANYCENNCPRDCSRGYSTAVWSCTTSRKTAPESASLTAGGYCWCQY